MTATAGRTRPAETAAPLGPPLSRPVVGSGDDGKLRESPEDEAVAVVPVQLSDGDRELELRKTREHGCQRDLRFHSPEGGAEAEVDAVSESQVPAVGPVEVKLFGV